MAGPSGTQARPPRRASSGDTQDVFDRRQEETFRTRTRSHTSVSASSGAGGNRASIDSVREKRQRQEQGTGSNNLRKSNKTASTDRVQQAREDGGEGQETRTTRGKQTQKDDSAGSVENQSMMKQMEIMMIQSQCMTRTATMLNHMLNKAMHMQAASNRPSSSNTANVVNGDQWSPDRNRVLVVRALHLFKFPLPKGKLHQHLDMMTLLREKPAYDLYTADRDEYYQRWQQLTELGRPTADQRSKKRLRSVRSQMRQLTVKTARDIVKKHDQSLSTRRFPYVDEVLNVFSDGHEFLEGGICFPWGHPVFLQALRACFGRGSPFDVGLTSGDENELGYNSYCFAAEHRGNPALGEAIPALYWASIDFTDCDFGPDDMDGVTVSDCVFVRMAFAQVFCEEFGIPIAVDDKDYPASEMEKSNVVQEVFQHLHDTDVPYYRRFKDALQAAQMEVDSEQEDSQPQHAAVMQASSPPNHGRHADVLQKRVDGTGLARCTSRVDTQQHADSNVRFNEHSGASLFAASPSGAHASGSRRRGTTEQGGAYKLNDYARGESHTTSATGREKTALVTDIMQMLSQKGVSEDQAPTVLRELLAGFERGGAAHRSPSAHGASKRQYPEDAETQIDWEPDRDDVGGSGQRARILENVTNRKSTHVQSPAWEVPRQKRHREDMLLRNEYTEKRTVLANRHSQRAPFCVRKAKVDIPNSEDDSDEENVPGTPQLV